MRSDLGRAVAVLALCIAASTDAGAQTPGRDAFDPAPDGGAAVVVGWSRSGFGTLSAVDAHRAPRVESRSGASDTRVGPTVEGTVAGVRANSLERRDAVPLAAAQGRPRLGQSKALMIVGGAALVAGLIIGDDAGTVLAVGGAVVGLYGLYLFVR